MADRSLTELIELERRCDRFESEWQLGERPSLERYLEGVGGIRATLFHSLLEIELDYRRQRGEQPVRGDYQSRFPTLDEALDHFFGPELTIADVLKQLAATQLLGPGELGRWQQYVAEAGLSLTGESLLRTIRQAGGLTPEQVDRLAKKQGATLLLGDYVIQRKLGQGGMGTVWQARHRQSEEVVALKVLDVNLAGDPKMLSRFQREARVSMKLVHPRIVQTLEAVSTPDRQFLVLEYIDGIDLAAWVQQAGPQNLEVALGMLAAIAEGLRFAHERGVIHRDIKAANILRDHQGGLKILDMGLARMLDEGEDGRHTSLTATGDVLGTVDYMAPEQALNSKLADARSDVYSLGILLWFLLTGKVPYRGSSVMARVLAHRDEPVPSLRQAMGPIRGAELEAYPAVERLFETMVAKRPEERYPTMDAVLAAIRGVRMRRTEGA